MPKENWSKKIYGSEFLQTSFIFVIYLFKEVHRKIMSEIYFVGKTRYGDLTETGSYYLVSALVLLGEIMSRPSNKLHESFLENIMHIV